MFLNKEMKKIKQHIITVQEAEKLIEKYYEGETSVAEEKLIHQFLSQKNLPEQFEAEKAIFGYFESEKPKKKVYKLPAQLKWITSAAAVAGIAVFSLIFVNQSNASNYAYIDGVKTTNKRIIKNLAQSTVKNLVAENTELETTLENIRGNNVIEAQLDVFSEIEF